MLSKLFSKSDSSKNTINGEIQQTISAFLTSYRSNTFPYGFLAVCQRLQTVKSKSAWVVKATLPFPCDSELADIADELTLLIEQEVNFDIIYEIAAVREHGLAGVKNIIAVSSGKGGVGKSTTAVNLAYALIAEGSNVGILDADIYGPSIPTMMGLKGETPVSEDGKNMIPLESSGLSAMSIGFLVSDASATVWRGPMASRAFSQMLNETAWHDLDYLIVDMPPGTGDIQLTLAQQVPVAGAIVITTPQDIALADAVKGIAMFEQVKLPVLGVIENMSYHLCDNCGHHAHLFGQGGGERIANNAKTMLLGQLPLDIRIREDADEGCHEIHENSTGEIASQYRKIARNVAAQLYYQLDMTSPATPDVIVDK